MTSLPLTTKRSSRPPRHLADLTLAERIEVLTDLGYPAYRARQISNHFFRRFDDDPHAMTDLPAELRDITGRVLLPSLLTEVRTLRADAGTTVKTLWRLTDAAMVESVIMRYSDRVTVCVSSQAGCGMACPFCATGQAGLTRNLSTAEIVSQVVRAALVVSHGHVPHPSDTGQAQVSSSGPAISNVVFMGMGEPLANYPALVGALRRLTSPAPEGLGLSARAMTVSTVGLVPAIDKLAKVGLPVTLALSLHAPDDERRNELVPINTRWSVTDALDAARRYFDQTGRRVSIEYALIRDVNDQVWRAELLARLLNARGKGWVHVNPIPLNPTPGSRWTASRSAAQRAFIDALRQAGIPTSIRDTRGREIDGACGQLAASS
ncbi:MAG: 23S rRNA (adenine(2503)-C(2))-methyltransferase RlmN [Actinomycetota bacterium]